MTDIVAQAGIDVDRRSTACNMFSHADCHGCPCGCHEPRALFAGLMGLSIGLPSSATISRGES